jgi:hypothetical protein
MTRWRSDSPDIDCVVKERRLHFIASEAARIISHLIIAKPCDLLDELKGTKIYAMINVTKVEALPREEIAKFCEALKTRCKTLDVSF